MAERENKQKLLSYLKEFEHLGVGESVEADQFFREMDEDPEAFWKDWLSPLVAEGLNLDRACEVVLEGVLRPN
jgi:hypothetical protein